MKALSAQQLRFRARAVLVASAVAVAAVGCTSAQPSASPRKAGNGSRVIALNDISVLRSQFNRDQGYARLVLIFSPT